MFGAVANVVLDAAAVSTQELPKGQSMQPDELCHNLQQKQLTITSLECMSAYAAVNHFQMKADAVGSRKSREERRSFEALPPDGAVSF